MFRRHESETKFLATLSGNIVAQFQARIQLKVEGGAALKEGAQRMIEKKRAEGARKFLDS